MEMLARDLGQRRAPRDSRTRLLHEAPGEQRWEMWVRRPPAELAALVGPFWAGDADAPYACHRVLPNGELLLMMNLGTPQRVVEGAGSGCGQLYRAAWICGLQEGPLSTESVIRHPRGVAVQLRPLGAWALFGGLPLGELTNRMIDLESVLGRTAGVETLRQRLGEASDLGAALDLFERWVIARILGGPRAHAVTRAAWHHIVAGGGDVRIEAVARDAGVSPRYLSRVFHREIGLPAKRAARIVRFARVLDRLTHGERGDLAQLALDCGYFDQSHLNRDFRELTGRTPTEYLAVPAAVDVGPAGVPV